MCGSPGRKTEENIPSFREGSFWGLFIPGKNEQRNCADEEKRKRSEIKMETTYYVSHFLVREK